MRLSGQAGYPNRTILDEIVDHKRREVSNLPVGPVAVDALRDRIRRRGGVRNFFGSLAKPSQGPVALIAEVKKASPSAGVIREDFDPVTVARSYEAGGASCLSVLTDHRFFQGSLNHLRDIRQAVDLPLLRKDFIIDERQILEAVEWGADAILLIVAILDDERLAAFHRLATDAGLSVLVEVHDELELDRALAVGARLIGVNNRDLKTFRTDLTTCERLAARLAGSGRLSGSDAVLLIAESGIHTAADVRRLVRCGARAILVGESLMRQPDVAAAARSLLNPADSRETGT